VIEDKKTAGIAAALVGLAALHFLDRPSQPPAPDAPPSAAPTSSTKFQPQEPARHLSVSCGGRGSTISGDDASGTFVVAADAPLHDGAAACVVTFASASAPDCQVSASRYTVIPGRGKIEVVGPSRGEQVRYSCRRKP
jgi:hypothetical protein